MQVPRKAAQKVIETCGHASDTTSRVIAKPKTASLKPSRRDTSRRRVGPRAGDLLASHLAVSPAYGRESSARVE